MRAIDGARWAAPVLGAVVSVSFCNAHAQDGDKGFDRTPVHCVTMSSIKKTHALDDRTILFWVRTKIYRNYLPATCRDLAHEDRISYGIPGGSSLQQICGGNLISVVDRQLRTNGAPCALGQFHPITKEEAEMLSRGPGEQRDAIKVESAQLPPAADAGAEIKSEPVTPPPREP